MSKPGVKSERLAGIVIPTELDVSLLLRGLTAIGVVWWHTIGGYTPMTASRAFYYVPGRITVFIFFIISGYLIGYGFEHGRYRFDRLGIAHFWRNRFLRVYPLFFTVTVVGALVASARGHAPAVSLEWVATQLLMAQWWHNYDPIGVFWTLGIEMQFYLIAPLLLIVQQTKRFRLLVPLAVYAALAAVPFVASSVFGASLDNRTLVGTLSHFQAGFLVNRIFAGPARGRLSHPAEAVAWLVVAAASLSVATWFYHARREFFWNAGAGLVDVAGIAVLLLHSRTAYLTVSSKWFKVGAAIGALSYGVYAWHGFLLQATFSNFWLNFWWLLPASLALAWISYLLVELPASRLKYRHGAGEPSAVGTTAVVSVG